MEHFIIEAQMLTSALGIIWLGSHGSLRRPPSAAPPKKSDDSKQSAEDDKFTEGLVASDAIMFPLLAGCVLIGLYYLIEWLQNPDLLNKIIRAYLSVMSIASLTRLCADALNILVTVVFPNTWADRAGNVFRIDASKRAQYQITGTSDSAPTSAKTTPFPGPLSALGLSNGNAKLLWDARHFLRSRKWTIKISFLDETLSFTPTDVIGLIGAILLANPLPFDGLDRALKSSWRGIQLCHLLHDVTNVVRHRHLVLAGLFVYDIIMVFYT